MHFSWNKRLRLQSRCVGTDERFPHCYYDNEWEGIFKWLWSAHTVRSHNHKRQKTVHILALFTVQLISFILIFSLIIELLVKKKSRFGTKLHLVSGRRCLSSLCKAVHSLSLKYYWLIVFCSGWQGLHPCSCPGGPPEAPALCPQTGPCPAPQPAYPPAPQVSQAAGYNVYTYSTSRPSPMEHIGWRCFPTRHRSPKIIEVVYC